MRFSFLPGDYSIHEATNLLPKTLVTNAMGWGVAGRIVWAWVLTAPSSAGIGALIVK